MKEFHWPTVRVKIQGHSTNLVVLTHLAYHYRTPSYL